MSYILIIIIALITAGACGIILSPLAGRGYRKIMALCLCVIPLAALGAYLAIGQPDKAGAYAALDAPDSAAARNRDMQARIRELERAIDRAQSPKTEKLIELGTLRQRTGRQKKAIAALERAMKLDTHHATLPRKLGKAYFRAGLAAMRNGRRDAARNHWQKALNTAPKDAPYLPVIERAVEKLKNSASD